jgi:hypothetical protein
MTSVIAASIHAQKNSTGNTLPSQASVQNALAMVASLAVDDYRAAGAHRPREAAKLLIAMAHEVAITGGPTAPIRDYAHRCWSWPDSTTAPEVGGWGVRSGLSNHGHCPSGAKPVDYAPSLR